MVYDLVVIGAGVAGCAAALEGARLGLRVLAIDPLREDGDERFVRNLVRRGAVRLRGARALVGARLNSDQIRRAVATLARETRQGARRERRFLPRRLARAGVAFERGAAFLDAPGRVWIDGVGMREGRHIIVATGSAPRRPDRFDFASSLVRDTGTALLGDTPRSVVVLGAEAEGCEFACLFAAIGSRVTIVERRRRLLRAVDRELQQRVHDALHSLGIELAIEEELLGLDLPTNASGHARVQLASGRVEHCDRLLVLAGRVPRTDALDLDSLGLGRDAHGFLTVDEHGQTSLPGIYAAGDVTGWPFRASSSILQARAAARHAAGMDGGHPVDLPFCVHTIPEIASLGLGEDACRLLELPVVVGRAGFGRRRVGIGPEPLLKLIFRGDSGLLMGVQIIGDAASELINLGCLMMARGARAGDVADAGFVHPSASDAYREAALEALHTLPSDAEPVGPPGAGAW